jgi:hypothetical protein
MTASNNAIFGDFIPIEGTEGFICPSKETDYINIKYTTKLAKEITAIGWNNVNKLNTRLIINMSSTLNIKREFLHLFLPRWY